MDLEHLLRTRRIEKDPERNRRYVLRTAAAVLRAQNLLWIPAEGGETMIEGEPLLSPWDGGQLARLLLQDPDGARAAFLINNHVQAHSWGARFPQVARLLAVPVPSKEGTNWVVALNKRNAPTSPAHPHELQGRTGMPGSSRGSSGPIMAEVAPFRRTDAVLLLPMAALLGVQLRASRRHQQFKGLLLGLTRSLAAATDARDIFIAGHSERVARISVELGRELGLQKDELSDLYLCGLLHDIGKIGVRDSILRKVDPLAPEEVAHLRQHVTIGHNLLASLRPFAHLLPAVLHHHERYDGTGYPDGLKGDAIPFFARILAVAESYDAMMSCGPDHDPAATAPGEVEETLSKGADHQWDGRVIAAFFRCRDRIRAVGPVSPDESLQDALDAALRHADVESNR
jgi:HD-GYP domain-containing protein (c-di-GMP phosphodiesterase class II)